MSFLRNLLREAYDSFSDPDREARHAAVEQTVRNAFEEAQRTRQPPQFGPLRASLPDPNELSVIQEKVFREVLTRVWQRPRFTRQEAQYAIWAARCLDIPLERIGEFHKPFIQPRAMAALQRWLQSRLRDQEAEAELDDYALFLGLDRRSYVRALGDHSIHRYLVQSFRSAIADAYLSPEEWRSVVADADALGVSVDDLRVLIQPDARKHLEHLLADVQAGEIFDSRQEEQILWLLDRLAPGAEYRQYVEQIVATHRGMRQIRDGRLHAISPPRGLALDAGELLYFHGPSTWWEPRPRQHQVDYNSHHGFLAITDSRLIFTSPSKSVAFRLASIVHFQGEPQSLAVQQNNRPITYFSFHPPDPIACLILEAAVGRHRRTVVSAPEERATRHIPRDLRSRVWQRDGGQCVECGATEYLEFDHIIPYSRGGSSDENNLQVLCRRCNLTKSDRI